MWALGNLLFALAFQVHPFTADPPNLQILNGNWRVPPRAKHAPVISPLVEMMLVQDPARRPGVFSVTQAASVLHAEASAAGLAPAQSTPPSSRGGSMDRGSGGGGTTGSPADTRRPQPQAHGNGGSAFRFEDMMRDMDSMAPAAAHSMAPAAAQPVLPSWSADFSAFDSGGDAGAPAGVSSAASAPVHRGEGLCASRLGGGHGPGHAVAGAGGPGNARSCGAASGGVGDTRGAASGAASGGSGAASGGVGDLLGMLDQADPPAAAPWGTASPCGGPTNSFASSSDRPASHGPAGLSQPGPPPVAPSRTAPATTNGKGSGDDALFSPGARVLVVGLQARPELNGTTATVLGRAQAPGRFNVQSVGGVVALRPANMQRPS